MNDLDELLHEDGRAWQAPPVASPDLDAALARSAVRRSRILAGTALVTVVALAAGGAVFARSGTAIPATPAPLGTPSAQLPSSTPPPPSPTPPERPTTEPSDPAVGRSLHQPPTRQELAEVVRDTAIQLGIPAKVDAVQTNLAQAAAALYSTVPTGRYSVNTSVWLVQVQGEFSCGPCTPTQTGPEAGVGVLTLVLDAGDLQRILLGMGDTRQDMADLGTVVSLDPEADR